MNQPEVTIKVGNQNESSDAVDVEVDRRVAGAAPVYFDTTEEARPYPLAVKLLELDSVSAVLLQDQKVTVCRANGAGEWPGIIESVSAIIESYFAELPEEEQRERTPEENELMLKVQNLLNTEINPMVASHGGYIEVSDVRGSEIYMNMTGGCQGCAQSAVTLRQGVERLIAERIPEVTHIHDSTDHAAGTNPYYQ